MNYIYPRVPHSLLPEFKLWVLPGLLKHTALRLFSRHLCVKGHFRGLGRGSGGGGSGGKENGNAPAE